MKFHHAITIVAALAGALASASAAGPAFFAMDTGTRDANHQTPDQQVALVREVGFAGIAPIYRNPAQLRDMLAALDARKLAMFAVYVPLNLDSPDPLSPAIRDTTPFSPPSGQATGSFNGLHTESKFLAAIQRFSGLRKPQ